MTRGSLTEGEQLAEQDSKLTRKHRKYLSMLVQTYPNDYTAASAISRPHLRPLAIQLGWTDAEAEGCFDALVKDGWIKTVADSQQYFIQPHARVLVIRGIARARKLRILKIAGGWLGTLFTTLLAFYIAHRLKWNQ